MKQNSSQGISGAFRCLDRLVGVGLGTIMVSTEVLSPRLVVRWVVVGIGTILVSTGVLSLHVAVRWVGSGWNRYYYAE